MKINHILTEMRQVAVITLYFFLCLSGFQVIKALLLLDYNITLQFTGKAFFGALVLGKLAFVLERLPIGRWLQHIPPFWSILIKSSIYSMLIYLFTLGEKYVHYAFLAEPTTLTFWEELDAERAHYSMWAHAIYINICLILFYLVEYMTEVLGRDHLRSLLFHSPEQQD